jgi:aldehyde dehydrogenase (NAD+)
MIVPNISPTGSTEIVSDFTIASLAPGVPDTSNLLQQQRDFFATGQTKSIEFRLTQLRKLQAAVIAHQDQIIAAVQKDLGRAPYEAYFELNMLEELKFALKHLRRWVKPQRVATAVTVFPATAWVQPQPLGVVLIISPWNYPFQSALSPLVGAIAAGNCAIIKPSEHSAHTSAVMAELIAEVFDPNYIAVVEGDVTMGQQLLTEKFDHIFFTGSTTVGRLVMQAAAQSLTPVTLELGGKSPCIVDRSVPIELAAKRIAWGKFINAGQTCVAPDYLLVDRAIKDQFVAALLPAIQELYGDDPAKSPDYGRVINRFHLDRLTALLADQKILVGGQADQSDRYLAPTVVDEVQWDNPLMVAEIFGPILPILTYDSLDEVIAEINARPKPLALYIFATDRAVQNKIAESTSSGGVVINEVIMQANLPSLPFGGVGASGMGKYHGRASFDTFSHARSYLKRSTLIDIDVRSAPYTAAKLRLIKWLFTGR